MPGDPKNWEYRPAYHAVGEDQAAARDAAKVAKGYKEAGDQIEKMRIGLSLLTGQLKFSESIFERAGKEGKAFGLRAISEFAASHKRVDELFSKSTAAWATGFAAVGEHAQGAGKHLFAFASETRRYAEISHKMARDQEKIDDRIDKRKKKIREAQDDDDAKEVKRQTRKLRDLEWTKELGKYEEKVFEFRKAAAPLAVIWGETVGRVLEESYKLQRNFRDINLDFGRSVNLTGTILSAMASSRGLLTLQEATEAVRALRDYSLDLIKPEIVRGVSQIHAVTGMSLQSIAGIVNTLRAFGTEGHVNQDVRQLGNAFTYFARETDLGAAGVSTLLDKMGTLTLTVPEDMRTKLITQVLAMGDAFKNAGLDAGEMLDHFKEMQNIFSKQGVMQAAMAARTQGIAMRDIMQGTADPTQVAMGWTRFMSKQMKALQGRGMSAISAATMWSRIYGGSVDEWIKAGAKDEAALGKMQEQMERDKKAAEKVDNLHKALDELTSGPLGKLSALFSTFNVVLLEAGTNIVKMINGFVGFVDKIPGVHAFLSWLFHSFTDEGRGGFRWAVGSVTKAIVLLTPVLGLKLIKSIGSAVLAGNELISALRILAKQMIETAEATVANAKIQEKGNATQLTFWKEEEKLATKAATAAAQGGWIKNIIKALVGPGVFDFFANFGKKGVAGAAEKVGVEALEKGAVETAEKGALKYGGKIAGKLIPAAGEAVSLGMAAADIAEMWKNEGLTPAFVIKAILKTIGGIFGGLTPAGTALSIGLDAVVAGIDALCTALGWNTKATEEQTKANKPKPVTLPPPPSRVGGLRGRVTDVYGGGAGGVREGAAAATGGAGGGGGGGAQGTPGSGGPIRAECYGPNSEGATAADKGQIRGSKGQLLQPGDYAVSADLAAGHEVGETFSFTDAAGRTITGRYADVSMKSPGNPNTRTIEQWNGRDLGYVSELRWNGAGGGQAAGGVANSTAVAGGGGGGGQAAGGVAAASTAATGTGGGTWGWGGPGGENAPRAAATARQGGKVGPPVLRPVENLSGWGGPGGNAGATGVANFFRKRGDQPITSGGDPRLTRISVGGRGTEVNKEAAPSFQGFISDLAAAGAPITDIGGWNYRTIAGSKNLSMHAYGGAIDINQESRNVVSPKFQAWIQSHPGMLQQLEQKWNIYGGERFGDLGHFEWGGVPLGGSAIAQATTPSPTAPGGGGVGVGNGGVSATAMPGTMPGASGMPVARGTPGGGGLINMGLSFPGMPSLLGDNPLGGLLGSLLGAVGRSISHLFLRPGAKTPTALAEHARQADTLTAADKHHQAMLHELRHANHMQKERLFYIRRERFVGPTLLASAAENTLANA